MNDTPRYKCGKCGSKALYRDDDRLNEIKYIACLICGNRFPPGPEPVKSEKSGLKEIFIKANSKDESMENTQRIDVEVENKPLCEQCGLKPTISARCPYCPSCMAKRSHKKKKGPESAFKADKTKKAAGDQAKAPGSPEELKGAIIIEFKSHTQILKEVEKLAEREMRLLDCQILYILKRYIEAEVQQCPG